jgi:hypothetical protein
MTFGPFQIGCMTHFKVADGQVPIADSPLYRITFWIFRALNIRVFWRCFSGFPAAKNFRPLLAEPLFYWVFRDLGPVLDPYFGDDFGPPGFLSSYRFGWLERPEKLYFFSGLFRTRIFKIPKRRVRSQQIPRLTCVNGPSGS